VQRILTSLESKGLIKRISRYSGASAGRLSNAIDLSPLARKVSEIAKRNPKLSVSKSAKATDEAA
jgi:hypothetical protein